MTDTAAAPWTQYRRRGLVTASVMLATLLQVIDVTIAAIALPEMRGALSTTQEEISWVLTSYIVASAIMTPPVGWLAARFGRKRLFIYSIAGFTIASMFCGMAGSLDQLVAARIAQGACGAVLVPLSQATLLDAYPRERHGFALGIWSVGLMIGPVAGPTVGAYITEELSWPWIFYINIPLGIIAILGVSASVIETERKRRPIDLVGFAALSISVGAVQLMLDRGELRDWFESTEIVIEAGIAVAGFYVFITHSLFARQPFIDFNMFRDRNFSAGLVLAFMFGFLLLTTIVLMPPFLQQLLDYPIVASGLVLIPRGLGAMFAMMISARLFDRMDGRILMILGIFIFNWSMYEMTKFTDDVSMFDVGWTGALQGFGLGLFYAPLNVLAFSTLPLHFRTDAAGIFNLSRNVGSSLGIAILVSLLTRFTQINHASITESVHWSNELLRAPYLPERWQLDSVEGLAALNQEITQQAYTIAFLNDFKLLMILGVMTLPLVLLFKRQPRGSPA